MTSERYHVLEGIFLLALSDLSEMAIFMWGVLYIWIIFLLKTMTFLGCEILFVYRWGGDSKTVQNARFT